MHLVNTIKYLFMSFLEFSVCIIVFNDLVKMQYQQCVTRGARGKNYGDSLIFFHAAMFEEHLRYLQSLIYKLSAQSFSDTSLTHTHTHTLIFISV